MHYNLSRRKLSVPMPYKNKEQLYLCSAEAEPSTLLRTWGARSGLSTAMDLLNVTAGAPICPNDACRNAARVFQEAPQR